MVCSHGCKVLIGGVLFDRGPRKQSPLPGRFLNIGICPKVFEGLPDRAVELRFSEVSVELRVNKIALPALEA